jgi:glutaredoxin
MHKVKLFTTDTCAYCKNVKTYLGHKGVEFTIIDCTQNPKLLDEASKVTGQFTVPQTRIGREVIVGLDYGKLADALRKNGLMQ